MKILEVTSLYYPSLGGLELHVQTISEALASLGHEVVVATIAHDKKLPQHEFLSGVEIWRFPSLGPSAYRIPVGMYRFLKRLNPTFDIVHAHNYGAVPLILAALACQEHTIITPHYHGHGYNRFADLLHFVYDPFASNILKRIGGVVCDSSGEAQVTAQKFRIPLESIKIIPSINSFPIEIDLNQKQQAINELEGRCVLLSVGRLVSYKQIDRIISIVPYLPKHFTLTIIGTGPEKAKLEKLAHSLNIDERILFLGKVSEEDLCKWYTRAKIVISLSQGEAYGRTIIEGLSAKCHVVCSNILAFRDFASEFPDMVSLIPPEFSCQEIANLVIQIAARPDYEIVDLSCYTSQSVVNNLLKIYTDVYGTSKQKKIGSSVVGLQT